MIVGKGGLMAYLGTSAANEVEERVKSGDLHARMIYEGMAYQVSKEIGAGSVVLNGHVDAILLTGGIAYNELFIQMVTSRVSWIAPVIVFPGEDEMRALAQNILMIAKGELLSKTYS